MMIPAMGPRRALYPISQVKMYPSVEDRSLQGWVTIPSTAVMKAPLVKEIFLGAKLTSAFAGATTLAAMLVEMVASKSPMRESTVGARPWILLTTCTGSEITSPKMTVVELVTATPRKENKAMNTGSPIAWPVSWAFWLLAYLVKSGMFSDSVDQKPTLAVTEGRKTFMNWPSFGPPGPNWEVAESMGPMPLARQNAHARRAPDRPIRMGAEYFSTMRMLSIPLYRTPTWTSQKARKNPNWGPVIPPRNAMGAATMGPASASYSVSREVPPTQVWIPNHTQATRPRRTPTTVAPRTPKAALVRTGKGTPYLVPLCAFRIIGTRTIALLTKTVMIPCHQDIPSSTRLPAR
mmetsp:Transcript_8191/g.28139  ORF Transcript_8191/g.28139 Transcript_8191/m.28139 type:complete len:349 (-) Transcript_8191:360-1406(-)